MSTAAPVRSTLTASEDGPHSVPLEFIEAEPSWRIVDLRELWRFRELLLMFALRDLKVRYRQALIGVAWAVLQPLATLAIFQVFFGLLQARPTSEGIPYGISALAGLAVWQLFATGVRDGAGSLVQNRQLLTKVYFPRLLLPASSLACALVDCLIAVGLLVLLMVVLHVAIAWTACAAVLFLLLALATGLACAVWLAALNALYRDIGYVVPLLLQIGFFVSPVVYETVVLIPRDWVWLYGLNPLVTSIDGFRWALLGTPPPQAGRILASTGMAGVLLLAGLVYFRRVETRIADRI